MGERGKEILFKIYTDIIEPDVLKTGKKLLPLFNTYITSYKFTITACLRLRDFI